MREAIKKAPVKLLTVLAAAAGLVGGCASERGPHPELPRAGLATQFTSHNLCSLGVSPEIQLFDIPAGATRYRVRQTLVSALIAHGWEAEVPAHGAVIPEGALADYPGPCPPERQIFTYRIEVMAFAGDGRPLAYGWNFVSAPALSRVVAQEQNRVARGLPAIPPITLTVSQDPWQVPPTRPAFFSY